MSTPNGHKKESPKKRFPKTIPLHFDPDQVTYNIEPGIRQLWRDLDRVVDLQKESLRLLDRIQASGEKLFSHEVFPRASKILTIEQSFSANCLSLISCAQYLRNQACLTRIILYQLVSLSTGQDLYLKDEEARS